MSTVLAWDMLPAAVCSVYLIIVATLTYKQWRRERKEPDDDRRQSP